MPRIHPALRVYAGLPLRQRLLVRARLLSSPLEDVARRVTGARVADVGCGHGLAAVLMTLDHPERVVVGVDPDPRKIGWARRATSARPNLRFELGTVDELARREPGAFDTVTVADVLYLLPVEARPPFLRACRALLQPGGRLLLLEAEDDGSWRARKAVWQERVMVRLLGLTRHSGGLVFLPREKTLAQLSEAGFAVEEIAAIGQGTLTPHLLYGARSV